MINYKKVCILSTALISFVSFSRFTSVLPPPPKKRHKIFLRDHNGNKATQLFCVIPAISPRIYVYIFSFFIVDFPEKAM